MVEGLFDSNDIEPLVRFGVRLGASESFAVSFLSKSLTVGVVLGNLVCVNDLSGTRICLIFSLKDLWKKLTFSCVVGCDRNYGWRIAIVLNNIASFLR